MSNLDRVEQIYQAGLERIEKAPDYHYTDSKKRGKETSSKGIPTRGLKEVKVHFKAKQIILSGF